MTKADLLVQQARKMKLQASIEDCVVVQVPNSDGTEAVVVVWNRKGEHLAFSTAYVRRNGQPNRKLRNASEAQKWISGWKPRHVKRAA